jgi:hypothetical protein
MHHNWRNRLRICGKISTVNSCPEPHTIPCGWTFQSSYSRRTARACKDSNRAFSCGCAGLRCARVEENFPGASEMAHVLHPSSDWALSAARIHALVCDLGGADLSATAQCVGGTSLDQASAAINQFLPARFHTVRYLPWSCLVVPSFWGTLIRYVPTSQATSPLCL